MVKYTTIHIVFYFSRKFNYKIKLNTISSKYPLFVIEPIDMHDLESSDSLLPLGPIIMMGNPGGGKSTLLNGLAGEFLFKSGLSVGRGLTCMLEEKHSKKGVHFIDTPGLEDVELRKQAAQAITQALKRGGNVKVIFVVTIQDGRVLSQDSTMLKIVLEAAEEIGNSYGIIINKVKTRVYNELMDSENKLPELLTILFYNLDKKNKTPMVLVLPVDEELDEADDKVPDLKNQLKGLKEFVDAVPWATLTRNMANDIDVRRYDELKEIFETITKQLKGDDEGRFKLEKEKLVTELSQALADKDKYEKQLHYIRERLPFARIFK